VPSSVLLPIIFAFTNYKKLDKSGIIILYYLLLSGVISILAEVAERMFHNNLPLLHFYTLAELLILVEFYKRLEVVKSNTAFLTGVQVFFTVFCIANVIFWQHIKTYPSYSLSLDALILMLLSVIFYAKILNAILDTKTTNIPSFWFNSGIFLYFSGSFFLFIFSNFINLNLSGTAWNIIWNLHALFVFIMYILFTVGFIKCKK